MPRCPASVETSENEHEQEIIIYCHVTETQAYTLHSHHSDERTVFVICSKQFSLGYKKFNGDE